MATENTGRKQTGKFRPRPKAGTSGAAAAHRRRIFVEEYIANGGNATAAAKTAGYSPKTARRQGSRLLTDVHISQDIAERQSELAQRHSLATDDVIRSMARALHFDPRKLFNEHGNLKAVHELDPDTADALASIEVVAMAGGKEGDIPVQTKKYKWQDKSAARDQALKYLGLYKKENEQKKSDSIFTMTRDELEKIARGE